MPVDTKDIFAIVEKQNQWRGSQCINLIASENTPSPAVRSIQLNDFMGRYAEGHPNTPGKINRYYQGTQYIDEIETMAAKEMRELFGCAQAEVRPYSGNNANTAIAMGYLRGGDAVIANSTDAGGHISHNFFGIMGRRIQTRGQVLKPGKENSVNLHFFPLTADRYHIDVQKSIELIEKVKPNLLVMGKSLYLFPDPVKELAPVCRELGIPILYDGAHVLGLIAGGQFQDPLAEGATWLTGSTHKTFPGPQRGVILGNLDAEGEKKYWGAADRGVFPGTSSNHHLYSLPALLVAVREMKAHGKRLCRPDLQERRGPGQGHGGLRHPGGGQGVRLHPLAPDRGQRLRLRRRRQGGAGAGGQRHHLQLQHAPRRQRRPEPLGPAHRHPGDDPLRHEGKGFRRAGRADGRRHQGQDGQGQGQPAARPLPGNAVRVGAGRPDFARVPGAGSDLQHGRRMV